MARKGGKLVLVFALVLGLVASVFAYSYVNKVQKDAQASVAVQTVPVVVAAKTITPRTIITPELLAVKQVPVEGKHPAAYAGLDQLQGKISKSTITEGEQVLSTKLFAERAESGLAFIVPPGKRAVSIAVTEIIGAGGLVVPGDGVDIIGVFEAKTMGKDMAAYIIQNVEVLAVAQLLQGDEQAADTSESLPSQAGKAVKSATKSGQAPTEDPEAASVAPRAQPKAKSVTLAVTPEEAERLVLAEERGKLRLALRRNKDGTMVELPAATLGTIRTPLTGGEAQITAVEITPTTLRAGETMKIAVTIKNTSNAPLRSQGPDPNFTYVQGQTFHSQNFASQNGRFRIGLMFDGQAPVLFPYRWGFGGDLAPGTSTTIVGYVKFTSDIKSTNFWVGLLREPAEVLQDNMGTELVTVTPSNTAVVGVDVARVRSGPSIASSIIAELEYGTIVPILGQQADWYKIRLPDGKEGWMAAGWNVAPDQKYDPNQLSPAPAQPTNPAPAQPAQKRN